MQVYGLDNVGAIVRPLNCINVQWNARYYEVGSYQIQLRAQDWDISLCYITMENRKQTGLIEKVELQRTIKGDFVLVSGRFLECILNWRFLSEYKKTDGLQIVVPELITGIENITLTTPLYTDTISVDVAGGAYVGDTIYAALKAVECAPDVGIGPSGTGYILTIRKGTDKSGTLCFGPSSGTALEMTASVDNSNFRNFVRAFYTEGTGQKEFDVNYTLFDEWGYRYLPQGLSRNPPRRDIYLNTGKTKTAAQTQEALEAEITAQANTERANYPYLISIEAQVSDSQYVYREDYDIGSKVSIESTAITPALTTRIVGVDEVWKNNEHTIKHTYGDLLPINYR